jgi:hypothetical protein
MSRISRESVRTMSEMERDLDCPEIQWPVDPVTGLGGTKFVYVPSQSILGKMLASAGGGFSPTGTAGFFIRKELFDGEALPAAQEFLVSAGQIYRILNQDTSADGAFIFLDCAVKDRAA